MHQQFLLQLLSPNEMLPIKTADLLWDLHGFNLFMTIILLYVQHIMWKSEAVMDTVMENDAVPYWTLGCCEMSFSSRPTGTRREISHYLSCPVKCVSECFVAFSLHMWLFCPLMRQVCGDVWTGGSAECFSTCICVCSEL